MPQAHLEHEVPLSPYRVIWDLLHTVDLANTIITHDAGSPRDQLSPFWETTAPLTYIGWGKTTQLGYGLGYAMGAKLAQPEQALHQRLGRRGHRLHRHGLRDGGARAHPDSLGAAEQLLDGDRAEGDAGRDHEVPLAPTSPATTPRWPARSAAHGERVTRSGRDRARPSSAPSVKTQEGVPALLEFITEKAEDFSMYPVS